jgi:hypothetical protein
MLFGYAGYALPATLWLSSQDGAPAEAGAVCSLLAGVVSLVLAVRFDRRATRRQVIGLHAGLVPTQFVLSVPSNVPLLGLLISTAILILMRPVFPRLRPKPRKFFLTLHVGFSVGWLGSTMAMTALAGVGLVTDDDGLRHHIYRVMHVLDLVVIIPVVLLAVLSGLVVSLFTQWGLARHWWVLIKFALAISIPALAGVQHLWIAELIARTADDPQAADDAPGALGVRLLVCFVGYTMVLWTSVVLSVYKPGGKTPWARAEKVKRHSSEIGPGNVAP